MVEHFDTIVIGVGGMGSATLYELAKAGQNVLGLEAFDIPHDRGSSHGVNRIIRLAYYEDAAYVPLLQRAYELWHELEDVSHERLLITTGSLDAGPEDDEVFQGSYASCLEHGLNHEVLDADALAARFPAYQLPAGFKAVWQPDGGFLLSERCIVAFVMAARARGARVRARERVLRWHADNTGVQVHTSDRQYHAEQLVITAGAWASRLIPELNTYAQAERQVLGWFEPSNPRAFTPEAFPVFNLRVPDGRYYGFPEYSVPGFKIGRYHHLNEHVNPDTLTRDVTAEDERVLRDCVSRYFPAANGATMSLKTCMFTNSPDEHFIIGKHPAHERVTLAAGFSGHGFKFCAVIGEIMAQLVTRNNSSHALDLFAPERFLSPDVR